MLIIKCKLHKTDEKIRTYQYCVLLPSAYLVLILDFISNIISFQYHYVFDREKDFRMNVCIDYMTFWTRTMFEKRYGEFPSDWMFNKFSTIFISMIL